MMKKTGLPLLTACLLATILVADERPTLDLQSAQLPAYPVIARAAHVSGDVVAEFTLDERGTVTSVTILSGNGLLARSTEDNIRTWKFGEPPKDARPDTKYRTRFSYHLSNRYPPDSVPLQFTVTFTSYEHVDITGEMHYRTPSY